MKALHALLLTAAVCHTSAGPLDSAATADAKEVVPAINGIVSPAFFRYASGVAVKVCTCCFEANPANSYAVFCQTSNTSCCPGHRRY